VSARIALAVAAVVATCGLAAPARAALPPHVDLRAQTIGLYPGQPPLLAASGAVLARIGAVTLHADALRYDLTKNRIVASGNVTVSGPGGTVQATVYALDVASDDGTALQASGALPQTLLIPGGNVAAATVAPPAPGAFDAADLGGQRPYVAGRHAVVTPNAAVRFTPARVLTDLGRAVPAPTYLYDFAANPSFAQQALPASTFDQPYGLFGTPNSLAALHVRYVQDLGLGVGIDEHLVNGSRSYLVASAATGPGGAYNLIGFEQMSKSMSQQFLASYQTGIAGAQYQLLHNEYASVTSLTLSQVQGSQAADLRLSSLSHAIPHFLSYKLSVDVGLDHQPGMVPYSTDTRTTLEGLFTTPTVNAPLGTTISSSLDLATTVYNFPREAGTSALTTFVAKKVSSSLGLLGTVQFLQSYNHYRNLQSFFYPPETITLPDGSIYYGYLAYSGASTFRTYALTATYAPNPNLNVLASFTHHRDFPQFDGFGNPPYAAAFDVRVRLRGGPAIELGRSYLFDWGGQRFSPTWTLSLAP
jgi:hypothetical protein